METTEAALPDAIRAGLIKPAIRLYGPISDGTTAVFLDQLAGVAEGSLVIELNSTGGDADVGRRIAEEIRLLQDYDGRDVWVTGKAMVASAAVTIMAAVPRARRWLTRDTTLLIHGRRLIRDLRVEGPLKGCRRMVEEVLADIDQGLQREEEGFARLVEGTPLTIEKVREKAFGGWYLTAQEALAAGLVGGII